MSDGHDLDHDDADAHDDHGFDGEPATTLGPDEPQTPSWLPLVGVAVFATAGVIFLTQQDPPPPGAASAKEQAPVTVQTVAQPRDGRPAQPIQAQPGQPGDSPVRKVPPVQTKELQRRFLEAQQKKQQEAGGAK